MLRYLRLAADEPRAFLEACRGGGGDDDDDDDGDDAGDDSEGDDSVSKGGGDAEAAIGCLRQLDEAMTRLAGRGLMPYNPAPLVRRLRTFLDALQRACDDVNHGISAPP
jgi:hypothetical protein